MEFMGVCRWCPLILRIRSIPCLLSSLFLPKLPKLPFLLTRASPPWEAIALATFLPAHCKQLEPAQKVDTMPNAYRWAAAPGQSILRDQSVEKKASGKFETWVGEKQIVKVTYIVDGLQTLSSYTCYSPECMTIPFEVLN